MKYPFREGFQYYMLHKPYGVLSQFTPDVEGQICLKDIIKLSKDVYPVGRLDKDSEGLLILSNDPQLNQWLLHPKQKKPKTYLVQVEGIISDQALEQLILGVNIRIKGKEYLVHGLETDRFSGEIPTPRNPPIRERKNIPTSWCYLKIIEGKNRQVRRMFAQVNFPVLRLIRTHIDELNLNDLKQGEMKSLT